MGFIFKTKKYYKKGGLKKEVREKSPLTRTLSPKEKKFIQQKIGNIKGLVSKSELKGTVKKLYESGKISRVDRKKLKKMFGIKKLY